MVAEIAVRGPDVQQAVGLVGRGALQVAVEVKCLLGDLDLALQTSEAAQARAELLTNELDMERLARTLRGMQAQTLSIHALTRPTPFALPLMVERFRERLSTETLADRLARMVQALEQAADATTGKHLAQHAVQPTDMVWDVPDNTSNHTQRARRETAGNTSRRTHPKRGSAQAESAAGTGRQGYRPGRRRERAIQRTMSGSGNMGGTADAMHSSLRG